MPAMGDEPGRAGLPKSRVEALPDGIIAVAMTILVLHVISGGSRIGMEIPD